MIDTLEALRERYPPAHGRSVAKQLSRLDHHCIAFIALAPFVVLATGASGEMDASPRGGPPGFVKVTAAGTLLLPDFPGNNRLDSLSNLVENDKIGLLFLIPGGDETLRVNGRASLSQEAPLLAHFAQEKRMPRLVIEVAVTEAYLHCAKALMRAKLWDPASSQMRSVLPTMGQMLNDHTGMQTLETQQEMEARYASDL
ncbi:pyridoxamine 5'-phosphate oxidase family protein [Massilia sp. TWP1-3-3]|uniref:pyridoxamine 5'-phosphate oxidase family protein n=1 Tax=Massilia sp. TWP1-3-3 TaxID=2804573 RepID=UPI003CFA8583